MDVGGSVGILMRRRFFLYFGLMVYDNVAKKLFARCS